MKTIQTSVIIYLIGIFSQITIDAQQQNPIKSYNGIPIITYVRGVDSVQSYYYIPPQQYDTIINSGVKFIQVENMTNSEYYSHLEGKEVFILPEQYFIGQNTTDKYITYYTEGRYSEWPTVGTDSLDGKATLKSLETHTEKYGGLLRTLQTNGTPLSEDTIVYGPQYWQDVYYRFHNIQDTTIKYIIKYKLKLEEINPLFNSTYTTTDTVCILQVTAKDTYNRVFTTGLPVYVIKEKAVTVGELLPFNTTKTFEMTYTLENVPDSISDQPIVGNTFPNWQKNIAGTKNLWAAVKNIEFRIVWKSNSDIFRLYMDTIKVYDDRGWEIINQSEMQQKIINQVTQAPYKSKAAGWMSVDEPVSIDQMAPIRKVSELIESVSPNAGLWINYNAGWNDRFVNYKDLIRKMKEIE